MYLDFPLFPELKSLQLSVSRSVNLLSIFPSSLTSRVPQQYSLFELFQNVFASSQIDKRLPFPGFFKSKTTPNGTINPRRSLYIGCDLDNYVTARSIGFHAVLYKDGAVSVNHIRAICTNPLSKAMAFLRRNSGQMDLLTDRGWVLKDAFAQFLILDAIGDESLIKYDHQSQFFSWLYGPTPESVAGRLFKNYPPDIDTNSLAYTTLLHIDDEARHELMDKMLLFRNAEGILETYLTEDRVRIDGTACANAITLFNQFGRGHEAKATEDWIFKVLQSRAYREGTRYYPNGDFFLYFVSRLLYKAPHLAPWFRATLKACVLERTGAPGDALSFACRIIVGARVGVGNDLDFERLMALQLEDGSWGDGMCYRYAGINCSCYHRGLTAALAVLAVWEWDVLRLKG